MKEVLVSASTKPVSLGSYIAHRFEENGGQPVVLRCVGGNAVNVATKAWTVAQTFAGTPLWGQVMSQRAGEGDSRHVVIIMILTKVPEEYLRLVTVESVHERRVRTDASEIALARDIQGLLKVNSNVFNFGCIGAGAIQQTLKAIARVTKGNGCEVRLKLTPSFSTTHIDGKERTKVIYRMIVLDSASQ